LALPDGAGAVLPDDFVVGVVVGCGDVAVFVTGGTCGAACVAPGAVVPVGSSVLAAVLVAAGSPVVAGSAVAGSEVVVTSAVVDGAEVAGSGVVVAGGAALTVGTGAMSSAACGALAFA
jgi:hypothetical protein